MVKAATLATTASVQVFVGEGAVLNDHGGGGGTTCAGVDGGSGGGGGGGASPPADVVATKSITRDLGNVTNETDVAFSYRGTTATPATADAPTEAEPRDVKMPVLTAGKVMPVQVHIRYKDAKTGEEHLRVLTTAQPITSDRALAEECINSDVPALAAIQSAALLAQRGLYKEARIAMISTTRLLQRAMCTSEHQRSYMNLIVNGEQLDQFMRQKAAQEELMGGDVGGDVEVHAGAAAAPAPAAVTRSRLTDRDDDASGAIFTMKVC